MFVCLCVCVCVQLDKHIENLQSEFDQQRALADSHKAPAGARGACSVADRVHWALGCLHRLSKVQEVVSMMLGPGGGKGGKEGGDLALRTCLGGVNELMKEVDAFKKEAFENWQVRGFEIEFDCQKRSSHSPTLYVCITVCTCTPVAEVGTRE